MTITTAPSKVYAQVKAAVEAGSTVLAEELAIANAYAKKAKRGQIKDAKVEAPKKAKAAKEPVNVKNKGTKCSHDGCDRDAVSKGMCMRDYIRVYRQDPANKQRANEASQRYNAKKRAEKAAAKA